MRSKCRPRDELASHVHANPGLGCRSIQRDPMEQMSSRGRYQLSRLSHLGGLHGTIYRAFGAPKHPVAHGLIMEVTAWWGGLGQRLARLSAGRFLRRVRKGIIS
ncbi:hypothetical protein V2G26_016657 [Clonostachys chloroleuca]